MTATTDWRPVLGRRWAAMLVASVALAGCAATGQPAKSGGAQFLTACSEGTCGDGLSCICGVCTIRCDDESACGALAAGTSCVDPACEEEASTCDVTCTGDADCRGLGSTLACSQGVCRAQASRHDAGTCDSSAVNEPRCDPKEAPTPELDCNQRESEASDAVRTALMEVSTDCKTSADCTLVSVDTLCHPRCEVVVAVSGVPLIEATIAELDQGLCSDYVESGCRTVAPPCADPGQVVCMDGQCTTDNPGDFGFPCDDCGRDTCYWPGTDRNPICSERCVINSDCGDNGVCVIVIDEGFCFRRCRSSDECLAINGSRVNPLYCGDASVAEAFEGNYMGGDDGFCIQGSEP